MSDDGRYGITLIAFIGSVFSPYYAWARRGGKAADPRNHCALNVALYGPRGKRWAMTERGRHDLQQGAGTLVIGPSSLRWDGDALHFDIDEVSVPLPSRIRGRVRVVPQVLVQHVSPLDRAHNHCWAPICPRARVEVSFDIPSLKWSGAGYCDSNFGDAPMETDLRSWNWSRGHIDGASAVLYDVLERSGERTSLALRFDRRGTVTPFDPPGGVALPASGWRISRATRSTDACARVQRTLEDTPFYARSVVSHHLLGANVDSVHESLDLDRFRAPLVQAMLPFRMPRRA